MNIIDAHTHYLPSEIARNTSFYQQGWSDLNSLQDFMKKRGINRSLLVYPTTDAHLKMGWDALCTAYNQEMRKVKEAYKDTFIIAGVVPLQPSPDGVKKHLEDIRRYGFEGISLSSSCAGTFLDDSYYTEVYDFCRQHNVFVFVHPQTANPIGFERVKDPLLMPVIEYVFDLSMCFGKLMMEGIFERYPTLKFVFSHFGGVLPFLKDRFDTVYHMLRSRDLTKELPQGPSAFLKNVYADTSGVKSPKILALGLEAFGVDRILWGSDYPVSQNEQDIFKAVDGLDEPVKKRVLSGNALSLIGEH